MQYMNTNAKTHRWTKCTVRELGIFSPKGVVTIKFLYSGFRELFRREN